MYFIHTKCGGRINTETRTCLKCHRKWNPISFRLTATEIRPVVEREEVKKVVQKAIPTRKQYASWADRFPGVPAVAKLLPNWPRWARLLVTAILIGIVVVVVLLVLR